MERRKLWLLTEETMAEAAERSARKISSFSVTCNRLSRYLREKGSLGDLGFSLSAAAGEISSSIYF